MVIEWSVSVCVVSVWSVSDQLVVSVWSVSVVSECVCVVSERSVCGQEWSVCCQ